MQNLHLKKRKESRMSALRVGSRGWEEDKSRKSKGANMIKILYIQCMKIE
jgi:hypothetical protein